jgi:hypothetical protein
MHASTRAFGRDTRLTSLGSLSRRSLRKAAVVACLLSLGCVFSGRVEAQARATCHTDRAVWTVVGAGLGAAAGAIPATIVHRHDQVSSHRIVAGSIAAGALVGFVAAGRDRPCVSRTDSSQVADAVVARRSSRAGRGALSGVVIGGILGAVGGTFYNVGCERDPCHENRTRVNLILFSAGEGALAGGILGGLIGWAWPMGTMIVGRPR